MILKRGNPPPEHHHDWAGLVFICPCCQTEFLPAMTQQRANDTCAMAYCEVCKTQHCYEKSETYPYLTEERRKALEEMVSEVIKSWMGVQT